MVTITEGAATIAAAKPKVVSRNMPVFYNPIMQVNRDVSVLLLKALGRKNMQIGLPLAGTGIRGIRFLKELPKSMIKALEVNDYDRKAITAIKKHFKQNKLTLSKTKIHNEDANLFLLNSKGFDYIDVDPFGSSNPFLDSAVKRIAREGVLAVTNTDTASLTGTYPAVCKRKYWSTAKLDWQMHETGLRILIRKVQLIGSQFEKALIPIYSYYKDHYFRVFFKCVKGKKEADAILKQHGMIGEAGPVWLGQLWDSKLAAGINKLAQDDYNMHADTKKFVSIIAGEAKIPAVGFYDIHTFAKKRKIKQLIKKEELLKKIRKLNHKAAETHFSGTGIRTTLDEKRFTKLL